MAGVNHVPVKADLCASMGIRTPAFSCFFTTFAPSSQQKGERQGGGSELYCP